MTSQDEHWMRHVISLARNADQMGEVPVAAVLISDDNQIIAENWNQPISSCDPTAHAEIKVLQQAGKKLQNYRLLNTTLYVTMEPCIMCVGALIHARVSRVVFGAYEYKTGAAGSVENLFQSAASNFQIEVDGGVLAPECSQLISDFFARRRLEKRAEKLAARTSKN
ncbi:tRNA adenosine(34) deaminase TadA [Pelagibaculum spongiae]|uniref:tRNA-specific adenosine deaminase n=1 Tax=Pelagibaculum spongiae TaxID=2080658 RepID=A0A2V1GN35_9GAMM|nr:tRNA adenosine(34) deaminase TadA [Pelagibaculum spongiae]PVZ62940.1 tRNA adenosine(34) deaminase TadA [Pelagibaculum spongiae]